MKEEIRSSQRKAEAYARQELGSGTKEDWIWYKICRAYEEGYKEGCKEKRVEW